MAVEFTQEVTSRLESDHYGWLTTVAKSGQPVPKLVWFYFDGTDVVVYTMSNAAKVRHITNHPRVSLNLDSDGNGGGIIVVGGLLNATRFADPLTGRLADVQSSVVVAVIATLFATINIAGGFLVTRRMLAMFRK